MWFKNPRISTFKKWFFSLLMAPLLLTGCTLSFISTGGKQDNEKSIYIAQFDNSTGLGTSDMQVVFTEKAKDYFQQNGKFDLSDSENEADVSLVCTITSYKIPAVNASGNSSSNLSKLEIGVKVDYIRHLYPNEQNNLKGRTFTFFKNFSADEDFNSIEAELIDEISEQLIINIFNSTVGYW